VRLHGRSARAQQPAMPVIGYLTTGSPESDAVSLAAFREGLSETGYVETQNVTIQYGWAEFQYERLEAMAADLVNHRVSAIATLGGTPSALVAKATSTIPIVFFIGIDPIEFGLIASYNHPGGNMTWDCRSTRRFDRKAYRALTRSPAKCSRRRFLSQSEQPFYRDRSASIAGQRAFSRT
jgi:ABC transporter substrate binding protein